MTRKKQSELIRAAGGLVWREKDNRREILVIHRSRYDDWTLPKGKLKDDERWEEAAVREVTEETGYKVEIVSFADSLFYYVSKRPKLVLFWNMKVKGRIFNSKITTDSPDEGDQVRWLTPKKALGRITYESEKALLLNEFKRKPNLSKSG